MGYIGNSVVGVEHPSTSALNATTGTFTGNVTTTGTVEPAGDTAAGDDAAIGYTSAEGLILTGQGSTSDITLKNDADATVFTVPTGTDDILFPDSAEIQMGAGADLKVSSDGTNGILRANNGRVFIQTDTGVNLTKTGNAETMLIATPDGSVDLYHNNTKKIETTSTGVTISGNNPGGKIRLEMGQTGVANTDVTGEIQFYHNDASGAGVNADIKGICTNSAGAGALTFGTGTTSTTERMRILSDGRVLIGTTSELFSQGVLQVKGNGAENIARFGAGADAESIIFENASGTAVGSIQVNTSATAFNTSSDYRLKTEVTYDWNATTRLKQLKPARFKWISEGDTAEFVDGFLANEAQTVVPEAVSGTHNEVEVWKDGEELPDGVSVGDNKLDADGNTIPIMQGIDQAKIVPLLTKALIESVTKIEALEARITALENA